MAKKSDVIICAVCGEPYVVTHGGRALYCEICRKEVARAKMREFRENHKGISKSAYDKFVDRTPLQKPNFTLSDVCAAARKHNMSYGQYVAARKMGRVEPPEKLPGKPKRGRKKK